MPKSDPTKDPEFKRVLGNLLKEPPKTQAEVKANKELKPASKIKGRPANGRKR